MVLLLISVLNEIVEAGRRVPDWLDADFIFHLNYGPLSPHQVNRIRAQLEKYYHEMGNVWNLRKVLTGMSKEVAERVEMTFLDRPIAAKLYKTLYGSRQVASFATDWSANREGNVSTHGLSPFDYDSFEQTFPLLWAENFIISWVWRNEYSSSIIGSDTKPPMAAVVLDMIDLVNYLKSISESKTIVDWLTEFVRKTPLQSLVQHERIDEEWAGRGYIADLFSIVACLECTSRGPPPVIAGLDQRKTLKVPMQYDTRTIPGFGILIPSPKPVSNTALNLANSVDELQAAFIQSGPFKLKVTRKLAKHLCLNKKSQLRVFQYWNSPTPEKGLPRKPSLRIYKNHVLRRCTIVFTTLTWQSTGHQGSS